MENFNDLNGNENLKYITVAYIEQYGFDRFVKVYMKDINMRDKKTRNIISEAVGEQIEDTRHFKRIFKSVVREVMEENAFSYDEALEFIADGDYVIPTDAAFAFALDFSACDADTLNELIRARAELLLESI